MAGQNIFLPKTKSTDTSFSLTNLNLPHSNQGGLKTYRNGIFCHPWTRVVDQWIDFKFRLLD